MKISIGKTGTGTTSHRIVDPKRVLQLALGVMTLGNAPLFSIEKNVSRGQQESLQTASPFPENGLTTLFNPATYQSLPGKVRSIQTVYFANRPVPHVRLILESKQGTLPVDLGPQWYIDAEGINIIPLDEIIVEGSLVSIDGQPLVIASKVTKGNDSLQLRTPQGIPLWSGWRKGPS